MVLVSQLISWDIGGAIERVCVHDAAVNERLFVFFSSCSHTDWVVFAAHCARLSVRHLSLIPQLPTNPPVQPQTGTHRDACSHDSRIISQRGLQLQSIAIAVWLVYLQKVCLRAQHYWLASGESVAAVRCSGKRAFWPASVPPFAAPMPLPAGGLPCTLPPLCSAAARSAGSSGCVRARLRGLRSADTGVRDLLRLRLRLRLTLLRRRGRLLLLLLLLLTLRLAALRPERLPLLWLRLRDLLWLAGRCPSRSAGGRC